MPNHFVSLESSEGCGKTTQARLLTSALVARGHEVVLTREPGGTPGAEAIRSLLLSHDHDWSPRTETLLFAAARSEHVERVILPALRSGKWVICDRYIDSTRAYQGVSGAISDRPILDVHNFGTDSLMPELTILLDAPEPTSTEDDPIAKRLAARDNGQSDRIGGKPASFHAEVRQIFRQMAKFESRFHIVSALGTVEEVHQAICSAVRERFPGSI